jgi:membrane peptidoglycan carboxypeptidase
MAHKLGITSPLDAVPSITLGTSGVTPLEMADAYATFAAYGIHHKPQAIVKVYRKNGKLDWAPQTKGKRVVQAGVASVVTQCLERVASAGTGSETGSYFPYPRAGKTGTTENGWDVWYCGYTPQLAAAVWMGDADKNSPMDGAYGGTYCAPMWAKFYAAALKDEDHPSFKTYPWDFAGTWESGFTTSPSASSSASPSKSGKPSPGPTKTITPAPQPTKTKTSTPKPTPTKTKTSTPKPTPTPTGTPTAGARQVIQVLTTPFEAAQQAELVRARARDDKRGAGDTGLAGAAVEWVADLLGL